VLYSGRDSDRLRRRFDSALLQIKGETHTHTHSCFTPILD